MGNPRVQVEDATAKAYLRSLPPRPKQELSSLLPNAGKEAFSLLEVQSIPTTILDPDKPRHRFLGHASVRSGYPMHGRRGD